MQQHLRRGIWLAAVVMLAALASVGTPFTASAAERLTGDNVNLAAGQRVDDDLLVAGREAVIAGTVTGDLYASSAKLIVSGQIDGNATSLSGTVEVPGIINGSLRVAGGDLTVSGQIGGDLIVASGSITITSTAQIGGDLLVRGGDVSVRGSVGGSIKGSGGDVMISAPVGGDVEIDAAKLRLGQDTRIAGNLSYSSPVEVTTASGAIVTGTTEFTERSRFLPSEEAYSWVTHPLFRLLAALMAGLAFVILLPRAAIATADGVRRVPWAFVLGLLLIVAIPLIAMLFAATVVGIPAAAVIAVMFLCLLYLSQVIVGLALGRAVMPKKWDVTSRGYNILAMALGVIAIGGLRFIPVPYLNVGIAVLTAILALGGVLLAGRKPQTAY